uniref:Uncharacterized protein n=1 Tax=Arundo donax TaxID=35708 RepID=A0A0A9A7U4_ARUDO
MRFAGPSTRIFSRSGPILC